MHRNISVIAVIILALTGTLHSQPDSLWSHTFGGGGEDHPLSLIQTADGGVDDEIISRALAVARSKDIRTSSCLTVISVVRSFKER